MQNQACATDRAAGHCGKVYSWFPVIIGGLIGVGLAFLLNLFCIAIGLSLFTTNPVGAKILAGGGIAGMLIGVIATMYTSGFVAGYLSGHTCCTKNLGIVYGFASWCFSLILMVLLASAIGTYVAAYTEFVEHPKVMSMSASKQVEETAKQTAQSVSNKANPTVTKTNTAEEKEVKAIGMQSFIIFLLFFIGAFSSALGGYIGYECWRKCKGY